LRRKKKSFDHPREDNKMNNPRESTMQADDGTPLFVRDWPLETPGRGGVVLMHGLGEHSGRYMHVARFFNERGWAVRAYDHRGHGRSGGPRGDVPDADAMLRDAKLVIEDFAANFPNPPLLLGHSMGGLIAAHYATRGISPLRGLILSSPALRIRLNGGQKILLKILSAIAPGFGAPNGLNSNYLSHDRAVVDAYNNDPLVHRKTSPRLLLGMLDAVEYAQSHAPAMKLKTLLLVAGDDHFVDPAGSEAFFNHFPPKIGTMHRYPALYHEIFNEIEAKQVFDDMREWVDKLP
jgi:alpha-beta hydrolase superfamily lysophospholipase